MARRPIPLFRDRVEAARIEVETPAACRFVAEMSAALDAFQAGRERPATCAALVSVLDLLYETLAPGERAVLRPLVRLSEALNDLDAGVVAPMLRPAARFGRPAAPRRVRYLRGLCGLALEARRRTSKDSRLEVLAGAVARDLTVRGVTFTARVLLEERRRIIADCRSLERRHPGPTSPIRLELAIALWDAETGRERWAGDYPTLLTMIAAEAATQSR